MRKTVFAAALIFFMAAIPGSAQDFKAKPPPELSIINPPAPLKAGETLEYSVEWLGIPVGRIILKSAGIVKVKGYTCYYVVARSFPNRFLRRLYDLEYKVYSFIDVRTLSSRRFVKIRRLNKKVNYVAIDFDIENNKASYRTWGTAHFVRLSKKRTEKQEPLPTPSISRGTQDLLSAFFYFRLIPMTQNHSYLISIYYNQANWPLTITTGVPFLREFRKKGIFPAIGISIASDLNEYVLGKHEFSLYLTIDPRRIPIEFKVGTSLGPIHGIIRNPPQ